MIERGMYIQREKNSLYQTLCMHMRDIYGESYGPMRTYTHTKVHDCSPNVISCTTGHTTLHIIIN